MALLILACASAAAADVLSPGPDAVSLAVYRGGYVGGDGVAFVSETRTIDLPAGRTRVKFEGVAEGIIPQSAGVEGLPGDLVERNYDYDLLGPGSLLQHAVGHSVRVVRIAPRTGRESETRAVIRSGPDGVVLDFGDRLEALGCDGAPERLVFDAVPPGLTATPTLSLAVRTPHAGRYTVKLNYLAVRLDWSADYIARVAPDGRSLGLTGWLTLVNDGATAFSHAPTAVVAGRLSRVPANRPRVFARPLRRACWPGQTTHSGWRDDDRVEEMAAAANRLMRAAPAALAAPPPPPPPPPPPLVIESALGDYHLYQLAEPTTLAARQTKQVMFLQQADVPVEAVFVSSAFFGTAGPQPASVVLRFDNTKAGGLGRGLPAGHVQLRRRAAGPDGRELLLGTARLARDVPVGEAFELAAGSDADVEIERTVTSHKVGAPGPDGLRHVENRFAIHVTNAKAKDATVEIRQQRGYPTDFQVTAESAPHGLTSGDPVWRLTVPAGGARDLSYSVSFRRPGPA
jgi:hypothetical protein